MNKKGLAVIVELAKAKKDSADAENPMQDEEAVAEEILAAIKDGDASVLASLLKDFVSLCYDKEE